MSEQASHKCECEGAKRNKALEKQVKELKETRWADFPKKVATLRKGGTKMNGGLRCKPSIAIPFPNEKRRAKPHPNKLCNCSFSKIPKSKNTRHLAQYDARQIHREFFLPTRSAKRRERTEYGSTYGYVPLMVSATDFQARRKECCFDIIYL